MKIVKIGRSSTNDVNVDDPNVSRSHCQIIQDDYGNYTIIDTNSTNGTFVNGTKRHGEVKLNPNDIVRIGNTTLPWQTYFGNEFHGGQGTRIGGSEGSGGNNIGINIGAYPVQPQPVGTKPDSFMVWAILSTIFCCLPFGIASIVNASKVDGLWASGDYNGANEAARKARTWFWWAFGLGVVVVIINIIYYVVVGVAIGMGY